MSIMGMAANICYLMENNMTKHPVNTAIFGKNVSAFLHEVTKVISKSYL
jgi:tetrahydromethanopterin S-methyltransferase subunit E